MTNSETARKVALQLIKTRRAFRQAIQRMLALHNIEMTFEMLQVMYLLWIEQGVSQQQLAVRSSKDKACLTNLINNLIKKGWVRRKNDAIDRRKKLIYLTAAGEALATRVRPVLDSIYETAGNKMAPGEMQICKDYLEKLNGIFDEI